MSYVATVLFLASSLLAAGPEAAISLTAGAKSIAPGEPIPIALTLTVAQETHGQASEPLRRRVKLHAYIRTIDSEKLSRTLVLELDRALTNSGELLISGLVFPLEPAEPFDDSALRPGAQYHISVANEAASLRSSEIVINVRTASDAEVAAARAFHAHLRAVVGMIEQGDEFEAERPALSKLISDYPSTPFARYAGAALAMDDFRQLEREPANETRWGELAAQAETLSHDLGDSHPLSALMAQKAAEAYARAGERAKAIAILTEREGKTMSQSESARAREALLSELKRHEGKGQ